MNDGFFLRVTSILSGTASKEVAPFSINASPPRFTSTRRIFSTTLQIKIQPVRRFGAIPFGALAYFTISQPLPNHPCAPSAQTLRRRITKGAQDLHKSCAPFCIGLHDVASATCDVVNVANYQFSIYLIPLKIEFGNWQNLHIGNTSTPPLHSTARNHAISKIIRQHDQIHTLLRAPPRIFCFHGKPPFIENYAILFAILSNDITSFNCEASAFSTPLKLMSQDYGNMPPSA